MSEDDKLTKTALNKYLIFTRQIALKAGQILVDGFNKGKDIKFKGIIDPVTQFDLKSEKYIINQITNKFPTHSILAEEDSDIDNNSPFRWVIDPLDGTVNYAHRFPVYSVSIALQYNNKSVVGVVYDPEREEMYSAASGMGAFLNSKKISVSKEKNLKRSLLATGFAYNLNSARKNNLGTFARMMKQSQAVRRLGSAALDLCWMACGRLDGFWEFYLHPWDTAAAIIIVEEAGGKVSQINGEKYSIFDDNILTSNKLIHNQMIKALTSSKKVKR
jgi:myo-inositol-1(or 4)-monophosphatase